MIAPQGLKKIGPRVARDSRKASVKIRRNPSRHQTDQVHFQESEVDINEILASPTSVIDVIEDIPVTGTDKKFLKTIFT